MEKVCPVCNGLSAVNLLCERCKGTMEDMGRVQDYTDPYACQQEINDGINYCLHLFKCKQCNSAKRIKISKISL
ncbi:hypothetical protein [Clostridium muellerianum]|uniref:hypothetical protein n=1 Tax=Clostridium muellerianum TaxID=2716538 RepID=UPI001FAD5056|nr:hypothetical protein [Clostridium muellerianum]